MERSFCQPPTGKAALKQGASLNSEGGQGEFPPPCLYGVLTWNQDCREHCEGDLAAAALAVLVPFPFQSDDLEQRRYYCRAGDQSSSSVTLSHLLLLLHLHHLCLGH